MQYFRVFSASAGVPFALGKVKYILKINKRVHPLRKEGPRGSEEKYIVANLRFGGEVSMDYHLGLVWGKGPIGRQDWGEKY